MACTCSLRISIRHKGPASECFNGSVLRRRKPSRISPHVLTPQRNWIYLSFKNENTQNIIFSAARSLINVIDILLDIHVHRVNIPFLMHQIHFLSRYTFSLSRTTCQQRLYGSFVNKLTVVILSRLTSLLAHWFYTASEGF